MPLRGSSSESMLPRAGRNSPCFLVLERLVQEGQKIQRQCVLLVRGVRIDLAWRGYPAISEFSAGDSVSPFHGRVSCLRLED